MDCTEFKLFVHAYIDGEFEPADAVELEAHMAVCESCRALAQQQSSFLAHVKETWEPDEAPSSFKSRIVEVLEAQEAMELATGSASPQAAEPGEVGEVDGSGSRRGRQPLRERLKAIEWVLGPSVAAAAAVLLVLMAARQFGGEEAATARQASASTPAPTAAPTPTRTTHEGSHRDLVRAIPASAVEASRAETHAGPIVEEAVTWHRRNLPIEVAGPSGIRVRRWFDGKVGFPVRLPRFDRTTPGQVNLLGARLSNVKERQAAYVVYEVNGSKMSVMAFDGRDLAPGQRRDRGKPIYFENASGYNVAVIEDNGITYSITSELPREDMAELVQAAFEE